MWLNIFLTSLGTLSALLLLCKAYEYELYWDDNIFINTLAYLTIGNTIVSIILFIVQVWVS